MVNCVKFIQFRKKYLVVLHSKNGLVTFCRIRILFSKFLLIYSGMIVNLYNYYSSLKWSLTILIHTWFSLGKILESYID